MKKPFFLTVFIFLLLLPALLVPAVSHGQAIPTIGKMKLKAGAVVLLVFLYPDGSDQVYISMAYEDQELYVYKATHDESGEIIGYACEGDGYINSCPEHGREPIHYPGLLVLVPTSTISSGKATFIPNPATP